MFHLIFQDISLKRMEIYFILKDLLIILLYATIQMFGVSMIF